MSDSHSGAEGGGNAPKAGCQPPLNTKKKKKDLLVNFRAWRRRK